MVIFAGGVDYQPLAHNSHTFNYSNDSRIIERELQIRIIDDNIVEPNEKYGLKINLVQGGAGRVEIGEMGKMGKMANITIVDDDGKW